MERFIFVSYASEDQLLKDQLIAELARWGIDVWSDDKLDVGASFNERIAHAIYKSRAMILISSGYSMKSEYVNAEVRFAHKLGKQICEISVAGNWHPDLTDIQRVEYRPGSEWPDLVADLAPTLKRSIGPSDVFIAYDYGHNAEQKGFIDWLTSELSEHGLGVWSPDHRVEFGDDRQEMTLDAIDRAAVVLAVLSKRSAASRDFSDQVKRALLQDDSVLVMAVTEDGISEADLLQTWQETMDGLLEDDRLGAVVRDRFAAVLRSEAAVFAGFSHDAQLIAQVARGLKKRQDAFLPDERVEAEAARVFRDFTVTMKEMGLDAVEVLSLPEFKAAELEAGTGDPLTTTSTAVEAEPAPVAVADEVDATEAVVDLSDDAVATAAGRIPKFCRNCGERTVTGTKFCRKCGKSLLVE